MNLFSWKLKIPAYFDFGVSLRNSVFGGLTDDAVSVGAAQLLDEMLLFVNPSLEISLLASLGHLHAQLHGGGIFVVLQNSVNRLHGLEIRVAQETERHGSAEGLRVGRAEVSRYCPRLSYCWMS